MSSRKKLRVESRGVEIPTGARGAARPTAPPGARPAVQFKELRSVAEVEGVCAAPLVVELFLRGEPVRFVGRRLWPPEAREIGVILTRTLPPELPPDKDRGEREPRYDFSSAKYRQQVGDDRRLARALVVYWCFPCFRPQLRVESNELRGVEAGAHASASGSQQQIMAHMESLKVEEPLLDELYLKATEDPIKLPAPEAAYVNFTSGSGSRAG